MDMVTSIFERNYIQINVDMVNKEQVLRYIAKLAEKAGVSYDSEQTYESMLKRENEFSTGFGDGFAIPHTKCASIKKPAVFILKLRSSVDWKAIDERPVSIIIGLLTPNENNGAIHLKLLASLSRKLMDEDFKRKFILSFDEEELFHMVTEALVAFENE
ncbi:fructose-specific phosphotransferase system IIA component [Anaerosolibacter carboniphilus]|uniref:Fructose-specific phosphotransferase system IIA component n=1 Tax=Anaerosolibacter carboniphilus TaxID=1417629 RepID=A0A841KV26_9FIRM|nr:PTS sugar transporter subunit IIA [Anaerosolibacter carboniphilus]MBB6217311.1 fructose-specific phosphotransferase system IIA component [Anaerosolibacter carboniphilus]